MASEAQVLANRRNAEKSTGPRTVEGKAVASQNAVTHGLSAQQDVISSEDHGEFDLHRDQMLGELDPVGPVERMLVERIVSLSWRLTRAERIQNEAFDYLIAKANFDPLPMLTRKEGDPDHDAGLALGKAVAGDFGHARALDRLLMYERRIENSLYRTMAELRRLKLMRPSDPVEKPAAESASSPDRQLFKTKPISEDQKEEELLFRKGVMEITPREECARTNPIRVDSSLKCAPLDRSTRQDEDRLVACSHIGG